MHILSDDLGYWGERFCKKRIWGFEFCTLITLPDLLSKTQAVRRD